MLVTLFSARIIYGLHRINISLHTLGHFLAYLSKVAQELRLETLCHSECISINQNLSVAAVTSTYSNRYSLHLLAYFSSELSRNLLQHDGKAACFVQRNGVADKFLSLSLFLGTNTITAKLINALRVSPRWP